MACEGAGGFGFLLPSDVQGATLILDKARIARGCDDAVAAKQRGLPIPLLDEFRSRIIRPSKLNYTASKRKNTFQF